MLKKTLFLLFISFTVLAAKPNVVLLSSLDTPRIWYHKKDWKIEKTLNKIFHNRFQKSGYNIVIKEKVDQLTLTQELSNPNNIAVFWVSHAASSASLGGGLEASAAVVDYHGIDVKDLFKKVHPNMKYLALVGCNAKGIINKFEKAGHYKNNKGLQIYSFDKKVDARIGLRKSIKHSKNTFGKIKKRFLSHPVVINTQNHITDFYQQNSCEKKTISYPVRVVRTLSHDSPTVMIKNSKETLGVFPAAKVGDRQEQVIYINKEEFKKSDLKLTADSNIFATNKRQYLGEFHFETTWDSKWKLFAKRDGTPLGITKNLFIYKGSLPDESQTITHQEYQCLEN